MIKCSCDILEINDVYIIKSNEQYRDLVKNASYAIVFLNFERYVSIILYII